MEGEIEDTEDIWSDIIYINFETVQSCVLTNLHTESIWKCLRMTPLPLFICGFIVAPILLFCSSGFRPVHWIVGPRPSKGSVNSSSLPWPCSEPIEPWRVQAAGGHRSNLIMMKDDSGRCGSGGLQYLSPMQHGPTEASSRKHRPARDCHAVISHPLAQVETLICRVGWAGWGTGPGRRSWVVRGSLSWWEHKQGKGVCPANVLECSV